MDSEQKEYKDSKKKKGITSKQKAPVVVHLEPVPDLKFMKKDDAVAYRKRREAAILAGKEAERKVLAESAISPSKAKQMDATDAAQKEVDNVKVKIRETKAELEKDPSSKRLQNRLSKLEEKLNDAEDALDGILR